MRDPKRFDGNRVRKTFIVCPPREMSVKLETLIKECDMSVNMVLVKLLDYAMTHMTLEERVVQRMVFDNEETAADNAAEAYH